MQWLGLQMMRGSQRPWGALASVVQLVGSLSPTPKS